MATPHHKGTTNHPDEVHEVTQGQNKLYFIEARALDVIWGGDRRYWKIEKEVSSIELMQVSWLEVTGSVKLNKFQEGNYELTFKLKLKSDAFGWADSPVYFTVRAGNSSRAWRKSDLSKGETDKPQFVPFPPFKFTVSSNPGDSKLQFGMYEIWRGRWKGGLVIEGIQVKSVSN